MSNRELLQPRGYATFLHALCRMSETCDDSSTRPAALRRWGAWWSQAVTLAPTLGWPESSQRWRPVLLIGVGLAAACAGQAAPQPAPGDGACTVETSSMTSTQALPGDVLLQSWNVNREGQPTGYRIFDDGRFERRRLGGPWAPRRSLSPAELTKLREAIITSGLLAAAGHHRAPSQPADATHREVWARSGNALVHLNIDGGCTVPSERTLMTAIVDLLR